jgi:hypothetical protein
MDALIVKLSTAFVPCFCCRMVFFLWLMDHYSLYPGA